MLCLLFFAQFCHVLEVCRVQYSRHTANRGSLPCAKGLPCASFFSTRQTHMFAVSCAFAVCFLGGHTANKIIAVSWTFAVCCFFWHTAKVRFAVCLCFSTRQRLWHMAKIMAHGNLRVSGSDTAWLSRQSVLLNFITLLFYCYSDMTVTVRVLS